MAILKYKGNSRNGKHVILHFDIKFLYSGSAREKLTLYADLKRKCQTGSCVRDGE